MTTKSTVLSSSVPRAFQVALGVKPHLPRQETEDVGWSAGAGKIPWEKRAWQPHLPGNSWMEGGRKYSRMDHEKGQT